LPCLTFLYRNVDAPTVREAFQAARGLLPREVVMRIAESAALADRWRNMIQRQYRETESAV
jgi:hypothetical protein